MKPSTGNTSIVQIKLCCHGAAHFMVGYTVLMQALTCGLGLLLCPYVVGSVPWLIATGIVLVAIPYFVRL